MVKPSCCRGWDFREVLIGADHDPLPRLFDCPHNELVEIRRGSALAPIDTLAYGWPLPADVAGKERAEPVPPVGAQSHG